MRRLVVLLVLVLFQVEAHAADREIRFWIGYKKPEASMTDHLTFIAQTLAPATIVQGHGGLDYYGVYIPTNKPLTKDLHIVEEGRKLFSEAALPSYTSNATYNKCRKLRAEYGPLHSQPPHSFQSGVSYSCTPQPFNAEDGAVINRSQPRETARVAYDLIPGVATGNDWRNGTTVAWLLMRSAIASDDKFYEQRASQFLDAIATSRLYGIHSDHWSSVSGMYARVDEDFVLIWMNVEDADLVKDLRKALRGIHFSWGAEFVDWDWAPSVSLQPYAKDEWYANINQWLVPVDLDDDGEVDPVPIQDGKVVNVQFVPGKPSDIGLKDPAEAVQED